MTLNFDLSQGLKVLHYFSPWLIFRFWITIVWSIIPTQITNEKLPYNLHANYGYLSTVTLTLDIWPWWPLVKVMTQNWVVENLWSIIQFKATPDMGIPKQSISFCLMFFNLPFSIHLWPLLVKMMCLRTPPWQQSKIILIRRPLQRLGSSAYWWESVYKVWKKIGIMYSQVIGFISRGRLNKPMCKAILCPSFSKGV